MRKRILIISNRGSADKSPVAELLLMPRLGGHLMSIETTNDDAEQHGQEVIRYDPENFTDYLDNLGRAPGNTVTHVGATDFLAFVNALTQTHALIHYDFVIVVVNRTDVARPKAWSPFRPFSLQAWTHLAFASFWTRQEHRPKSTRSRSSTSTSSRSRIQTRVSRSTPIATSKRIACSQQC